MNTFQITDANSKGNTFSLAFEKTDETSAKVYLQYWETFKVSKPHKEIIYEVTNIIIDGGFFRGDTTVHWLLQPEAAKITIAPSGAGTTPGFQFTIRLDTPHEPGGIDRFFQITDGNQEKLVNFLRIDSGWTQT